jgi:SAM-dependent methyltransferase
MARKWHDFIPQEYLLFSLDSSTALDIGCGSLPRNPLQARFLTGVDIFPEENVAFDKQIIEYRSVLPGKPLPFKSNEFNCVSAFDFLEHLPRFDRSPTGQATNPFIDMMNEIYRILKPGGIFIGLTPCFPSAAAFTDPTHLNFITAETHLYFSGPNYAREKNYGFVGDFHAVHAEWSDCRGILWESYAFYLQHVSPPAKIRLINWFLESRKQLKLKLRSILIGHGAETHFLWVLQKPEKR